MTTRLISRGESKTTFRADCITEKKYVGPKRDTRAKAEEDKARHLATPGHEDHEVEIERTQRSYIK